MGCGGSRTDALEPRYLESWTKETESTWLTSTDTDIPLSSIPSESSEAGFTSEKTISPGKINELRLSALMNEYLTDLVTGTGSNVTDEQINDKYMAFHGRLQYICYSRVFFSYFYMFCICLCSRCTVHSPFVIAMSTILVEIMTYFVKWYC